MTQIKESSILAACGAIEKELRRKNLEKHITNRSDGVLRRSQFNGTDCGHRPCGRGRVV
jgi:hypothetical protein